MQNRESSAAARNSRDTYGDTIFVLQEKLHAWHQNILSLVEVTRTLNEITDHLTNLRHTLIPDEWSGVVDLCQSHPILKTIHEDPFTRWAYEKPRGYPGDATLIDFIYHEPNARQMLREAPPSGQAIFARNRMVPACLSVRHRRDLLAAKIDEVCFSRPAARVLSVACGHLREGAKSDAISAGHLDVLIALDQDVDSLNEVTRAFQGRRVEPRNNSVRHILSGKFSDSNFDLIYSAGLYDYLEEKVARRLTRLLFEKLKPGGRLLIANFLDTAPDAGYMETFMDWHLILRGAAQFREMTNELSLTEAKIQDYIDPPETVVYLEIERL